MKALLLLALSGCFVAADVRPTVNCLQVDYQTVVCEGEYTWIGARIYVDHWGRHYTIPGRYVRRRW